MTLARALALILALLAPGCALLDEGASDAGGRDAGAASTMHGEPPVFSLPDEAPRRAIPLALAIENAWAKPLEVVAMRAEGKAVSYEWYVGLRDARARVTYVYDVPYVTDADAPGQRYSEGANIRPGPIAPRAHVDTGILAPGSPPLEIPFPVEGRYGLTGRAGTGGSLHVTVSPALPAPTPAYVRLALVDGRATFSPDEVDVHPGDRVTFLNVGDAPVGATLATSMVRLEAAGATTAFSPVDEGTFDVAVVARDFAGGRGAARDRVVSDFERPSTRATFGPYSDTFLCAGAPGCDAERSIKVDAEHPVRAAFLNLSTSGQLGASASVALLRNGREVPLERAPGDEGTLVARDLDAGALTLRVRGESGLLAGYTLKLDLVYRLPPPP